ncbi:MAG: FKBP-type peptidyl-prolyl cis-trans isomerase [Gammaproteobacteria bacterium]|jgi:FKBP-type peptidyl-prolyl cis-trans isomerase FklB|nr:FKBP-type peptidyl-prolyl cis-trans isomerase [Gammaproteobacteria bacterium]MDX2460821.1 FKBP-type peptidyl-prolyl cis-trans isomerase [Gammaproteobacteria bacterium]
MKLPVLLAAMVVAVQIPAQAEEIKPITTNAEKFSYGIGLQIGQQLLKQGLSGADPRVIAIAIDDVLKGNELRVTMEEMQVASTAYQNELNAEKLAAGEKNKTAGESFLKENSTREGIVVLDSGLQYRIVKPGDGGSPTETDTVVVHYRGRLLNGSEFDSSYVRGQPAELGVGQVIPGWQQALQLMPVGSKWEVWVPAALAYGAQGAGSIGPNETLHFDIELLEIKG